MDRSLTRLPLPEGLLQNLQKRGFRTCGDIVEVPPSKLANGPLFCSCNQSIVRVVIKLSTKHIELEINHQEALELWKSAKKLGE